jgi:hypothetical protein
MDWILFFLFIIGIIATIVLTIIWIILDKHIKKTPVQANAPLIENNYRKEFTNGYTLGILKSIKKCKNGCSRIEFYPTDVKQGEFVQRPDIQCFIVKNEFVKTYGEGGLSDYRQRIKTLPRSKLDLPEDMRNTLEGDYETKEGQKAYLVSTMGKAILTGGDEAIVEIMNEFSRIGMSKAEIARMRVMVEKWRKIFATQEQPEQKEDSKTK